jgi:hypothetical protein
MSASATPLLPTPLALWNALWRGPCEKPSQAFDAAWYRRFNRSFRHANLRNVLSHSVAIGLLAASPLAQAVCSIEDGVPKPDSRYEAVANAVPAGSEVRDTVTGLVWQRCTLGMAWNNGRCTGSANSLSWAQAVEAAQTASPSANGRRWRLPTQAELYSLADRACSNPAINTTWFPETPSALAWSSSVSVSNSDYAWAVNFVYYGSEPAQKNFAYRVRLVRAP